jgi:hypothetical protein
MKVVGITVSDGLTLAGPKTMLFMMCGQKKSADPDIVVHMIDPIQVLLLVQEDKRGTEATGGFPEGQLAAEMIAAFGNNNENYGTESQTMYGIIMLGSLCTFYKCHIDEDIFESIQMGWKRNETIMTMIRFSITESRSRNFIVETKQNMCDTLRCYEAMRIILAMEMENHTVHHERLSM